MASYKLVLEFLANGSTVKYSYNYAKPEATTANIKALMAGMITNGSIFENPPLEAKAAKLVTTDEEAFDLSD